MRFSHFGKRGQTRFPKKNGARDGGGDGSFAGLQIADFVVDEAAVPEGLVEVPAEAVEAVEEAEVEEVADAEVEKRAEGVRGIGI